VGKISETNQETAIEGEYITLGQLLKFVRIIDEGGMAKSYLASMRCWSTQEKENRRGRKLRPGDVVVSQRRHLQDREQMKLTTSRSGTSGVTPVWSSISLGRQPDRGDNGTGKSNLAEAIYYLSLAKSWRTNDDRP
jgi:ribosome-associated protein